jgi:hypothetical protein
MATYTNYRLIKAILRSTNGSPCWLLAEENTVKLGERVHFSDLNMAVMGEVKEVGRMEKQWIVFNVWTGNDFVELAVPYNLAVIGIVTTLCHYFCYHWLNDILPPPPQQLPDPTIQTTKKNFHNRRPTEPLPITFAGAPFPNQGNEGKDTKECNL